MKKQEVATKLPLWGKTKEGKYVRFPYADKFITFRDGKCGISGAALGTGSPWRKLEPLQHLFIYDIAQDRLLLKGSTTRWERLLLRWRLFVALVFHIPVGP